MTSRWSILAVLFLSRTTMAFQYQSIAALSPQLIENYLYSIADIGILIGLYFGPGILVAIPGGSIAARFGDKRVTVISLGLMIAGGILIALDDAWGLLATGRILSGIGGVTINVIMTKMLVDWFTGREIGTAMGILICSWPLGIALALLILPFLAGVGGLVLAWSGIILFLLTAALALVAVYQPADLPEPVSAEAVAARIPVSPLMAAALIWAFINAAVAMVFAFGPLLLSQQDLPSEAASSVISFFMLALAIGGPLGGILADRTGRPLFLITICLLVMVPVLAVLAATPHDFLYLVYGAAGFIVGISSGPIISLPSRVLPAETRALGMGIFFTVYYGVMMVAPALAGNVADAAGDTGLAYPMGAGMIVIGLVSLWIFHRTERAPAPV